MATITLNVPHVTLPVGAHVYGPATLTAAHRSVAIVLDRTIASGLDATPAATLNLMVELSFDGGATWGHLVDATIPGGVQLTTGGAQATTADVTVSLPGVTAQARATVTVIGAPVSVTGTVTIT